MPSKTEIFLAKKTKFDLFTTTNFSFMDSALHRLMRPNLFAVCKHDLANKYEGVLDFANIDLFTQVCPFVIHKQVINERKEESKVLYDATLNVEV
jgi:hypothetical protein